MAHPKETREALRSSYVQGRLTLEVVAAMHGVAYGTARRWKQAALVAGDDWDKAQGAQLLAGGGLETVSRQLLVGLVTQFQSTMEEVQGNSALAAPLKVQLLASLADAYNKTVAASRKVLPETSALAIAMQVLDKLAGFIAAHYPQHGLAFDEILAPFGERLEQELGA